MIVLAVIIVGIAVAAGVSLFGSSAVTANRDAVLHDCQTVISYAQQYYKKPLTMGGGQRSFTGLTLANLNWPASNLNGSYALNPAPANNVITVVGTGVEAGVSCTVYYNASNDSTSTAVTP